MITRTRAVLTGLGLAELALTILAARTIDRETGFPIYLASFLAMGALWLAASYYVLRRRPGGVGLGVVIVFALLFRIALLPTTPALSDDIYRYVWDGRVAHAGVNPYRYPPDAPELAALRNDDYAGINNKDIPTIYPPVMQIAFYFVTAFSESLFAMKAFFVLVEVALWLVLVALLREAGLDSDRLVIYAWSPLPIVEIGASGHNDVLGALFLMTALLAFVAGRDRWATFGLALSGLAKVLGFALVPLFVRQVSLRALALVPLAAAAISVPYLGAGGLAFRGLREYAARWRGNDGLFHLLFSLTGSLDGAKIIAGVLLAGLSLAFVARRTHPVVASYATVGAILLLSPTVHPWYFLWIAPFLVLFPNPAWLYLSLSVALGYHAAYLSEPGLPWEDRLWVKLVEYVPFFLLLVLTRLRGPCSRKEFARF